MKQKSELFDLIKSLDKNEKRYFRLYVSSQKGIKNYLRLFNAIDKQNNYNEADIKKLYSGEKFISQLSFTKNYLYKLIIKSLVSYNSESSIDNKIHILLSQCKILFNKALFKQYFKTLQKVKNVCLKYERYGYLLQVLDMEKMIIKKEEIQGQKAQEIYIDAINAMDNLKKMFGYTKIAGSLLVSYRGHGIARNEDYESIIKIALESDIMNTQTENLNSRSRESFYRVHELINEIKGDYNESLSAQEKRLEIVNNFPYPFEDYIIKYSEDILLSVVDTCLKLNRIDEAEKYLKRIKLILPKSRSDEVDYYVFIQFTEFKLLMRREKFTEAAKFTGKLDSLMVLFRDKILIDTELSMRFESVKCLILAKEFDAALIKANELMKHPLLDRREDYECYLRVMNIIIHFELHNYDLLKYLIVSTYRFLFKRKKLYGLETLILEFIRRLPELNEKNDLGYLFYSFRKKLEVLKEDKYEKNAFEYFDFYRWIKEKSA